MYYSIPQIKIIIADNFDLVQERVNETIDRISQDENFIRILSITEPKIMELNKISSVVILIKYIVKRHIESGDNINENIDISNSGLNFGIDNISD